MLPAPAQAIVANPSPRLCAVFSNADMVVTGMVEPVRFLRQPDGDWLTWKVTVDHTYKGKTPRRFTLYSEAASASATPDDGKRNILFIERRGKRLTAWGSDPNRAATVREERNLQALASAPQGTTTSVVGLVAEEGGKPHAGWPVKLTQAATGRNLTVKTDAAGRFAVTVRPGKWMAKVAQPGWTSRMSLYSYDNADGFTARPGGCSDLRLEPVRNIAR